MRRRFIAGNWKMFNGPSAAEEFMVGFGPQLLSSEEVLPEIEAKKLEVAFFVPYISIETLVKHKQKLPVLVGAQNLHWEKNGAFTGEISAPMLTEIGCSHVLIGHSERRHIFRESSEELHKKVLAALAEALTPVFCVGELLEERESGKTFDVVKEQILSGLKSLDADVVAKNIIVAYEPVWAIGTGKTAGPEDAQEVCAFIRKLLGDTFGEETAAQTPILYGGSVKAENTEGILSMDDIDGVLVGGASLKPDSFMGIVKAAVK